MNIRGSVAQQGFTLIEVLIVVAIIGLISAIAVPRILWALDKSRDKKVMSDMRNIAVAIGIYTVDNGIVPNANNILDLITILQMHDPKNAGSLVERDAWGKLFYYQWTSDTDYTLKSFGKDRTEGNPATGRYFDAAADTIIISGRFVASHEGSAPIVK